MSLCMPGARLLGRRGDNVACPLRNRAALARQRAQDAYAALKTCRLCAHECGISRLAGERGKCQAGAGARVFSAQLEVGDEMELVPSFAVAFTGCDLRCDFCITGLASWDPHAGKSLGMDELAERARAALARGARSVMVLGGEPTVHLPSALALASEMPASARLVWKTNAHGSAQARELLEDVFDVWLADCKFGNDACALRLARAANYTAIVRDNLRWANAHSELIVRHLLMPGHVECCWRSIAAWLARSLPGVKTSLRDGFWPGWQAGRHMEMRAGPTAEERARATAIAEELGVNLIP